MRRFTMRSDNEWLSSSSIATACDVRSFNFQCGARTPSCLLAFALT